MSKIFRTGKSYTRQEIRIFICQEYGTRQALEIFDRLVQLDCIKPVSKNGLAENLDCFIWLKNPPAVK